jgi:hypothetical protein
MHLFEELYLELRNQAVALELSQNKMSERSTSLKGAVLGIRWALKDKRLIEGFIDNLHRNVETFRLTTINLEPEKCVSVPQSSRFSVEMSPV